MDESHRPLPEATGVPARTAARGPGSAGSNPPCVPASAMAPSDPAAGDATAPAGSPHRELDCEFAASGRDDLPSETAAYLESLLAPASAASPDSPESLPPGADHAAQVRVLQWINAYRFLGHFAARVDPLGQHRVERPAQLSRAQHGLDQVAAGVRFRVGSLQAGRGRGEATHTLDEIEAILEATYCGSIGAEYMHVLDTVEKRWIQRRLENRVIDETFDAPVREAILDRLVAAETLERYLHNRYVGQKRFSLEGAESLIPLLHAVTQRAGANGVREVVIGMAHRGRLNVQVNLLGKPMAELAREFEGQAIPERGSGDVKYHLGLSGDVMTPGGPLHLVLAFNPSHLEIVGPVVQGSVRARQVRRRDRKGRAVLPVVVHGDAAFAGQGVVMETFSMSQTRGFSTKGTLHVVVNNQIGFTTSTQRDARSTYYATDVAKMVSAPILHVNGDDPEAVVFAAQLALDYRMRFSKDIVLDLVCYRRHGHNEADEPALTQPRMYTRIRDLPTVVQRYTEHLRAIHAMTPNPDALANAFRDRLDAGDSVVLDRIEPEVADDVHRMSWRRFRDAVSDAPIAVDTRIEPQRLQWLGRDLLTLPEGFSPHARIRRLHAEQRQMLAGDRPVDWGFAETLAYATLLDARYRVRLVGQDSGRGTFAHRHAVLHDTETGRALVPLRELSSAPKRFLVIDSLLSEEAVLAFEYGYATTEPDALVVWEAQFGDFVNGAQVVIDQFLSSGEAKWGRLCGLVLLLPHGYEGQGPEHSSARPERFLQMSAEANWQVCVPTTPAQMFHLLRRQMLRPQRKPLIVMTPKSLLRHRAAISRLDELTDGGFDAVLRRNTPAGPAQRLLFTAGRIVYDLAERLRDDDALFSLEECYPWPEQALLDRVAEQRQAREWVWVQDEPVNQGYWSFVRPRLSSLAERHGATLSVVARPPAAAPAVGYPSEHKRQRESLLTSLFGAAE